MFDMAGGTGEHLCGAPINRKYHLAKRCRHGCTFAIGANDSLLGQTYELIARDTVRLQRILYGDMAVEALCAIFFAGSWQECLSNQPEWPVRRFCMTTLAIANSGMR